MSKESVGEEGQVRRDTEYVVQWSGWIEERGARSAGMASV